MEDSTLAVLEGRKLWSVVKADCVDFLDSLPANSVHLVLFSPPYQEARLYLEGGKDLGVARDTEEWVAWMCDVFRACLRVCTGLVCCVCEGQTKNYRYSCGPALLMADLHRSGVHLRKPPVYRRVGIPGSGGPDWLRNDWEWCLCATNGGRLPWSDNTACGHPPVYGPGGAMSPRLSDGTRVNQWGATGPRSGGRVRRKDGSRPQPGSPSGGCFTAPGEAGDSFFEGAPSPKDARCRTRTDKRVSDGSRNGEPEQFYRPPVLANPGNVIAVPRPPLSSLNIIDILDCYEQLTQDHPDQILRDLRQAVAAKDLLRWWARVYSRIRAEALLQSILQGHRGAPAGGAEVGRTSAPGQEDCPPEEGAEVLRALREDRPPSSSPPRRGCDEQRDGEPRGPLPLVPPPGTQTRRLPSAGVREALLRPGILFDALPEIQEVWRSFGQAVESTSPPAESSDVIDCVVGGGRMGSKVSSLNEAPYPEQLAEFFVLSFCPPGGVCLDPFAGSGTTGAVSLRHGRRYLGADLRQSQVDLSRRRLAGETPSLFAPRED